MFTEIKNIDTAFRYVKGFSLLFVFCTTLICIVVCCVSYRLVTDAQQHVYILSNGKALDAVSAGRKENIPVEAKDHIKLFHQYFFSFDPDEKVIQTNIGKAMYLADKSAKDQYDQLKRSGYYAHIISGNISQQITVDSIGLDLDRYPYYFKCYATEQMIRSASIVTRSLITEGYLRNVSRSDHNTHGFLIERWVVVDNKDLQVEQR